MKNKPFSYKYKCVYTLFHVQLFLNIYKFKKFENFICDYLDVSSIVFVRGYFFLFFFHKEKVKTESQRNKRMPFCCEAV